MFFKKVLITGGKGFIGRAFENYFRLWRNVYDLTIIDIKDRGLDCRQFFPWYEDKYDLVVHLAGTIEGREMIDGEPLRVASNLELDAAFWNWVVRTKQPRVIYYSSSAAYPIKLQDGRVHYVLGSSLPRRFDYGAKFLVEEYIDLENIQQPDQTYGLAKLVGEVQANLARAEGVNVHVLRPFSGYGEDQDLCYPFPSFIQRIKNKEDPFEIWGPGTQVRDFIHVNDIIKATMAIVDNDVQEPINLGCGRPTSFVDLANMMFDISGFHPEIKTLPEKPVGVMYRVADNTKMLRYFTPKISLEEGITRALNAY